MKQKFTNWKKVQEKKSKTKAWKKNVRKERCSLGKEYVDTNRRERPKRAPKPVDCSKCRYNCQGNFSEEERVNICSEYWRLGDYNRQKDFLVSRVHIKQVQRERARENRQKKMREASYQYFF